MIKIRTCLLVSVASLLLANIALAAVYKSVQPDGSVMFSDTPTTNSQIYSPSGEDLSSYTPPASSDAAATVVQASSGQVGQATGSFVPIASTGMADGTVVNGASRTSVVTAGATSNPPIVAGNMKVTIASPEDQQTFQNQDPITVVVKTEQPLQAGDTVQLIVDGKPYQTPGTSNTITINELERGTHQIQARVTTANGAQSVSLPVTIFKHQPSVLLNSGRSDANAAQSTAVTPLSLATGAG